MHGYKANTQELVHASTGVLPVLGEPDSGRGRHYNASTDELCMHVPSTRLAEGSLEQEAKHRKDGK